MHANRMSNRSKSNLILAVLCVLFLSPAILYFVTYGVSNIMFYTAVVDADPSEKEYLKQKTISLVLENQLFSLIVLLPGLVLSSFLSFYNKFKSTWFSRTLLGFSFIMLLSLPIITVAGGYLFYISRRVKYNA